jgi:hypothetical protein
LNDTELTRNLSTQVSKNTHTGFSKGNITPVHNTHIQEEQTPVCETSVSLHVLQQEIQDTIGETIGVDRLKKLMYSSSVDRLRYHLAHWPIHKLNQVKPGAGYFITVIENDIEPVVPPPKQYPQQTGQQKPQRDNFEQRDYTDEELESFYANLS